MLAPPKTRMLPSGQRAITLNDVAAPEGPMALLTTMGPVAGRLVSELIVDGKTSLDIAAFRFSRFAEGAIGRPRNVL